MSAKLKGDWHWNSTYRQTKNNFYYYYYYWMEKLSVQNF